MHSHMDSPYTVHKGVCADGPIVYTDGPYVCMHRWSLCLYVQMVPVSVCTDGPCVYVQVVPVSVCTVGLIACTCRRYLCWYV